MSTRPRQTPSAARAAPQGEPRAPSRRRGNTAQPELVVGFDAAWTSRGVGAIVGVLRGDAGELTEFGVPALVSYDAATELLLGWQREHEPRRTVVFLDQPTIVTNDAGWRPVEALLSSPMAKRKSAIQPANLGRTDMFGPEAPVWAFLARFGGAPWPLEERDGSTHVYESYPALGLAALGRCRRDVTGRARLYKYNPARAKTFALDDWREVTSALAASMQARGLRRLGAWAAALSELPRPRKPDQDALDACHCLELALLWAEGEPTLVVGDATTGFVVVPHATEIHTELETRCEALGWPARDWVRVLERPAAH